GLQMLPLVKVRANMLGIWCLVQMALVAVLQWHWVLVWVPLVPVAVLGWFLNSQEGHLLVLCFMQQALL
ncbi:hypothetical protein ACJX0J_042510, partial [Zea mays]